MFKPQEIDPEMVQHILAAAATSPTGIPPTEVGVVVFQSRKAVQDLRKFLTAEMRMWRKMFSPFMLTLLRPFIGKENTAMFKDFMAPAIEIYSAVQPGSRDWFFYDAPLAIYFYGTVFSDPADPVIPATYAMLAGEALGLGTCMLGFPGYVFKYSAKARQKYALPKKIQPGLLVIFGYPSYRNRNAIHRRFRDVTLVQ
jgi:nitroreductase